MRNARASEEGGTRVFANGGSIRRPAPEAGRRDAKASCTAHCTNRTLPGPVHAQPCGAPDGRCANVLVSFPPAAPA